MTEFSPEPNMEFEGRARPGILAANALYLIAGLGLILLAFALVPLLKYLQKTFGDMTMVQALVLQDALYYLLFLFLPCALVIRKCGVQAVRLNGISLSTTLLCIATAPACFLLANSLTALWNIFLISVGMPAGEASIPMANTGELLVAIFAVAVIPGIFEELLFRGIVLSAYERGGSRRAAIVTAVLFATLHGSAWGLPAQLVIGLVLGTVVLSTNSLYAGFMIHTGYNALVLMASYYLTNSYALDTTSTAVEIGSFANIAALAFNAFVALGVVALFLRFFRRYRERNAIALVPKAALRLSAGEIVLLVLGLLVTAFLYFVSIFSAFGGAA